MQDGYVISYESWKLKCHEENYAHHDLEFTAIVHALKMWKHYLLGKKFLLKTNNVSLKHFFSQNHLNSKQVRCFDFLSEFDFEIEQGRICTQVEDALSRKLNVVFNKNVQYNLK
jgi:hypothetical protein